MAIHAYRPDHYQELGVLRDADAEAIRTAYRALAKQLHPDLSEETSESKDAFLRLQEAYDVLRDPQRRADYDDELARREAMAQAAREAARRPIRSRPVPPTAATSATPKTAGPRATSGRGRSRRRLLRFNWFMAAIGLVIVVTGGIAAWQLLLDPGPPAIATGRVAPDIRDRPGRGGGSAASQPSPDSGVLAKEADRAVQAQVERVEAAKKRMEEERSKLEATKPGSGSAVQHQPPAMVASRVDCTGRGTNIVLLRRNGTAAVSYDKGPEVQPRISELSKGIVLVSHIEPTNKFAIAFVKGDRNGTTLLMFDQAGKVQQTFNVSCTAAAF